MGIVVRMVLATALPVLLAAGTGCRRAGPSLADDHPGIDTKPSGRALWENVPVPDPERGVIDLSRPDSMNRSFDPSSEDDDVVYVAAMRGEAWAQTKLGKIYVESSDDPERREKGLDLLQKAAAQKDAEAIYLLAGIAAAGIVDQPSNIEAVERIKEAAELGNADAQYELASMYAEGRGFYRDTAQAERWGRKAADQGHHEAQFLLGRIILEFGEPGQKSEALGYLQKAADAERIDALIFLANIVGNGQFGLAKDEARAESLLKPWAEKGNADCQFLLAALYRFGQSYEARRSEAYAWMQRAADQGHQRAIEILAAEGR